ncbi:hypothetical protein M2158_005661 [Streptomyces sp. SAI-144]|nr:hypothetical protein [Streptomyces sp. SAI-144]
MEETSNGSGRPITNSRLRAAVIVSASDRLTRLERRSLAGKSHP